MSTPSETSFFDAPMKMPGTSQDLIHFSTSVDASMPIPTVSPLRLQAPLRMSDQAFGTSVESVPDASTTTW